MCGRLCNGGDRFIIRLPHPGSGVGGVGESRGGLIRCGGWPRQHNVIRTHSATVKFEITMTPKSSTLVPMVSYVSACAFVVDTLGA